MQLILREDIHNLGKAGELVTVKPGYGRNYLLPQGKAVLASEKNVAQLEHEKRQITAKNARLLADARSIADRIQQVEVTINAYHENIEALCLVFEYIPNARPLRQMIADDAVTLSRSDVVSILAGIASGLARIMRAGCGIMICTMTTF